MLTAAQREAFDRDGFLVLDRFVDAGACDELIERADELMRTADLTDVRSIFTTKEQERTSDDYFLGSGGEIRFFFEEEAFAPDGELRQPIEDSINKIGHALHDLDPVFDRFSRAPALAEVAADVGVGDSVLVQSMYLCKQPRIGGEVDCHQDATFLYTEPVSVTGFWFALEDATLDNGCLWAAPGGQRTPLRKLFKRAPGGGTEFEVLDPSPLPDPHGGTLVPLEAAKGTLVVLDGRLPHWSDVNRSERSRHAYSVHVIDPRADYPAWNWLQRSQPLRGFTA
jgi:phytanoyl-CoA hydroxylase